MKKVLVPRVRFKGFEEEWKEERFDNIFFNIQEKIKIDIVLKNIFLFFKHLKKRC
ncbi:hypothetical protein NW733_04330 [Mycoplasmopsis felis]|uniref:hypothetical protein n=1 Tax=Mycoplasmopsis felis TaxID=33923 RepID=UPI0021DFF9F3|nr:hypothetical protein [Mycoplasmopsis felis]MCU9931876.1 hypothetical protein [Mycoplasmopsis felis]